MRWFSCFAILLYLSLLCTPQGVAVHDLRLAPLADHQLTAVTAKLYTLNERAVATDEQDDAATAPKLNVPQFASPHVIQFIVSRNFAGTVRHFSARAPPQS